MSENVMKKDFIKVQVYPLIKNMGRVLSRTTEEQSLIFRKKLTTPSMTGKR